jgi:hypothetical protein
MNVPENLQFIDGEGPKMEGKLKLERWFKTKRRNKYHATRPRARRTSSPIVALVRVHFSPQIR